MLDNAGLAVIGTGMVCALGNRSNAVCALTNAGISGYKTSNLLNRQNKPIVMAQVPEGALPQLPDEFALLNQQKPGHVYMVQLAAAALLDCLSESARGYPLPIFMACPEQLPGKDPRLETVFFDHLKILSGCNIDIANSRRIYSGRAGGFAALDTAYKYFQASGNEFALIGGVDSYRHFDGQVAALDKEKRLLAEGVADGFAIGEGASFLLIATPQAVLKHTLAPKLYLGRPASGIEPGHRYSDIPYRGDGLAQAFANALALAPRLPIASIYSSLNGESFSAKELGVARIRNHQRLGPHIPVQHPADCFGDLGAAMAPMLFSLIAHNEKEPSLVYCSADGPDRGAVCVWQPNYMC